MTEVCQNGICDGPCVCEEVNEFIARMQGVTVTKACRMQLNMFDIGVGRALASGEKIVNVMLHSPGEYDENDPSMLTMSFGKLETLKLIQLLTRGYKENWETEDE